MNKYELRAKAYKQLGLITESTEELENELVRYKRIFRIKAIIFSILGLIAILSIAIMVLFNIPVMVGALITMINSAILLVTYNSLSNSYEAFEQTKAELKAKHTKQVATKGNLNLK